MAVNNHIFCKQLRNMCACCCLWIFKRNSFVWQSCLFAFFWPIGHVSPRRTRLTVLLTNLFFAIVNDSPGDDSYQGLPVFFGPPTIRVEIFFHGSVISENVTAIITNSMAVIGDRIITVVPLFI